MTAAIWRLTATLRSGLLLISEEKELHLTGRSDDKTQIHFDKPKRIENSTWPNWDHGISYPMWSYNVIIAFEAKEEQEAQEISSRKLDSIAARLSFLGSAPVTVETYGSVTNAPEIPIKGHEYITISHTTDTAWENREIPLVSESQAQTLVNILVPDGLIKDGQERLERSMRWLQHSHFSFTPTDEFISLMLSFEAISHLLRTSKTKYWQCRSCQFEMKECPNCGSSTEWEGSGNLAIEEFLTSKLSWPRSKWQRLWEIRNNVLHARHDLSLNERRNIVEQLPELEVGVVNALRYLLKLPNNAPPLQIRQRSPFHEAVLRVAWKPKE
jgi:hypothetical protein